MTKLRSVVLLLMNLLLFLLASNSPSLAVSSADVPLLSPLPCIVTLDGKFQNIHPIYVNQKGESMVSLADAVQLFSCNIRFQTDGTVLVNHLATAKINGTILESGEIFFFNKTVGPRTIAAGYQEALIFVGDEIVPGIPLCLGDLRI